MIRWERRRETGGQIKTSPFFGYNLARREKAASTYEREKKSYLQRICLTNGTCSVHPCSISRSLPRMPNHYYLHFSFDKLLKSERCSKFASERKLHKKAFGTFRPFLTFPAQKNLIHFCHFFPPPSSSYPPFLLTPFQKTPTCYFFRPFSVIPLSPLLPAAKPWSWNCMSCRISCSQQQQGR